MTIEYHNMEQRSPEWFAIRRGRITASDVGAILGNSPNAKRQDVMRRMVRAWHGAENEFSGNIATEYGKQNEDTALIDFRIETSDDVEKIGFVTRNHWAGCSPDGLIGTHGGVEIKCPFSLRNDEDPKFKTLEEQPHYYDQVQFSLWVTGRTWWKFFQWNRHKCDLTYVEPDPVWRDRSLHVLTEFHREYLEERENPDEYLRPQRVEIDTPEVRKLIREYDELQAAIDNATERKKAIMDDLAIKAGYSNALIAGRKFTEVKKAGSISYAKAVREHLPDLDLEPYRGKETIFWKLS